MPKIKTPTKEINTKESINSEKEGDNSVQKSLWIDDLDTILKINSNPFTIINLKDDFAKLVQVSVSQFLSEIDNIYNDCDSCQSVDVSGKRRLVTLSDVMYYNQVKKYANSLYFDMLANLLARSSYYYHWIFFNLYERIKGTDSFKTNYKEWSKFEEKFFEYSSYIKKSIFSCNGANHIFKWLRELLSTWFKWDRADAISLYSKVKSKLFLSNIAILEYIKNNEEAFAYVHNQIHFLVKLSSKNNEEASEWIFWDTKHMEYIENLKHEIIKKTKDDYFDNDYLPNLLKRLKEESSNLSESQINHFFDYVWGLTFAKTGRHVAYKWNWMIGSVMSSGKGKVSTYKNWIEIAQYFDSTMDNFSIRILRTVILQVFWHRFPNLFYPFFLYWIKQKLKMSQENFELIRNVAILSSKNEYEWGIMSQFFNDLDNLLFANNRTITGNIFKYWWFVILLWALFCTSLVIIFQFPIIFGILVLVYGTIYLHSEYWWAWQYKTIKSVLGIITLIFFIWAGWLTKPYADNTKQAFSRTSIIVGKSDVLIQKGIAIFWKSSKEGIASILNKK